MSKPIGHHSDCICVQCEDSELHLLQDKVAAQEVLIQELRAEIERLRNG